MLKKRTPIVAYDKPVTRLALIVNVCRIMAIFCFLWIFALAVVWTAANDAQKMQLRYWLHWLMQKNPLFENPLDPADQSQPQIGQELKPEQLEEQAQTAYRTPYAQTTHAAQPLNVCKNTAVHTQHKRKLYKWQDSQQHWHFSDKFPTALDYQNLTISDMSPESFFRLSLNKRHSKLPAFASDRMQRDINYIYTILIKHVGVAQLNSVHLQLTLYDNRQQFYRYAQKFAPSLGAVDGFYVPSLNQAAVFTGRNDQRMYQVTRHEATHAIINAAFGRVPTWLNEGMAEYFEYLTFEHGMLRTVAVNQAHLQQLAHGNIMPLSDFLKLDANRWYNSTHTPRHYAQAWSLVYFLMSSPQNIQFLKYMLDYQALHYCQSFSAQDYIQSHYTGGLAGFERNWKQWLSQPKADHRY